MSLLADRLHQVGIIPRHVHQGRQRLPCPTCDKSPRDSALALKIDTFGATWNCHRCGFRGAAALGPTIVFTPRPKEYKPEPEIGFSQYAERIWSETVAITDHDVAGRYLLGRGCALPPPGSDLRWHPNLKHGASGRMFPALVGLVTGVVDKTHIGLHRTYLSRGSGKAGVVPQKMYLGEVKGGCCRIWHDDNVERGLGIGEGVETALSLAHEFRPVWCCLDAGHLADFPLLPGIEALTIAVDNDDAGIAAANACARRWADAGLEVNLKRSLYANRDLNDEAVR